MRALPYEGSEQKGLYGITHKWVEESSGSHFTDNGIETSSRKMAEVTDLW